MSKLSRNCILLISPYLTYQNDGVLRAQNSRARARFPTTHGRARCARFFITISPQPSFQPLHHLQLSPIPSSSSKARWLVYLIMSVNKCYYQYCLILYNSMRVILSNDIICFMTRLYLIKHHISMFRALQQSQ